MDNNKLLHMKKSIIETTNTVGWAYITKFANTVATDMERAAIDEEDDTKGNSLRREAKAARKFLNDLLTRIEMARQVDTEPENGSFLDIACD